MSVLPKISHILFKEDSDSLIFFPFGHRSQGYVLGERSYRHDIAYAIDTLFILFVFISIFVVSAFGFFYLSSTIAGFFFIYFMRSQFLVKNLQVANEEMTAAELASNATRSLSIPVILMLNMLCLILIFWGIREASRLPTEPIFFVSSGVSLAFFLTLFGSTTYLLFIKGNELKKERP